jgi:hypothetical protein
MTFSGFNPGETRSMAARIADEQREAQQPKIGNREFLVALVAILIVLGLFAVLLTFL